MNKRIIHHVVERNIILNPDRTAVVDGDTGYTYAQLKDLIERISGGIVRHCKERRRPVAVLLPPGFPLIGAALATFRSGQIYLPLDPSLDSRRLQKIFREVQPALCITSRALKPLADLLVSGINTGPSLVLVTEDIPQPADPAAGMPEVIPEDPNYIFYTSGSTGEPKAILGCHDSLSHFIHWEIGEFALDNEVRVSQLSQHTFDASLRDILVPLAVGGTVCIPPAAARTNIPLLVDWLERQHVTLVHCVPSVFRLITNELMQRRTTGIALPHLRHLLMAGEQLFSRDIQNWRSTGANHVQLVNLYGTSETTLAKTFHRIGTTPEDPSQPIHVGRPIWNAIIAVVRDGNLCKPGEIGEVYIITPFMTLGYYENEALTRQSFVQNPLVKDRVEIVYHTGDYGIYLDDGSLEILGRKDDQVKINGVRVELGEVKRAALRLEAISGAEVVAVKNAQEENELVCYYIASREMETELREFLPGELHPAAVPTGYRRMDSFPLTINGKVDRKMLPKIAGMLIPDASYVPAATPTERRLEQLWKEVLGLDRIGTAAAFFKIGGSSLKLIRMVSMIHREFGVSFKFADIFVSQTIAQWARMIDQARSGSRTPVTPLPVQENYQLSSAQQRLYAHDQVDTRKNLYNIVQAFELKGALQPQPLVRALKALGTRHEILRTIFTDIDGRPRQMILDNAPAPEVLDEAAFNLTFDSIQDLIRREQEHEFSLTTGPLFRATLAQTARDTWTLVFCIHHIVSDGWSQDVMLHDLARLYSAEVSGEAADLQPLPFQYKDYADWAVRQLQGARLDELELYWTSLFNTPFVPVTIPYSRDGALPGTPSGDTITREIDRPTTAALHNCAKQLGVTNFALLFAAVQVLLHHYSGSDDIVTGSPFSGRNRVDAESQLGLYVNLLPLRMSVDSEEPFAEIAARSQECLLGADEHQDYPIDLLTQGLEQQNGRLLLFNVLVQSQNDLEGRLPELKDLTVREIPFDGITAKADLTFNFQERDHRILTSVEYDTALYQKNHINEIIESLFTILRTITTEPNTRIKHIHLLKKVYDKFRIGSEAGVAAN